MVRLVSDRRELDRSRACVACGGLGAISTGLRVSTAVLGGGCGRSLSLALIFGLPSLFFLLLSGLPFLADLFEF